MAPKATRSQAPKGTKRVAKKPTRTLSATHKRAMAQGRTLSAIVDRYLLALNTPKRRGRKVSPAALRQRLADAQKRKGNTTGLDKVLASQEVRDCEAKLRLASTNGSVDIKPLEAAFVKVAAKYTAARKLSYGAWRDAGVPAPVLSKAGIARTRG